MIEWKKFSDETPEEGKIIIYYGSDYDGKYTGVICYKNPNSIIEKYAMIDIENGNITNWAYINFPEH